MEAIFGDEAHKFYGMKTTDMWGVGKRSVEWDLNDWKWDGDLFIASPLNPAPSNGIGRQFFPPVTGIPGTGNSSISSSSRSDEVNPGTEKGKRELEKRRRAVVIEDDSLNDEEVGNLSLKLGGHGYPIREMGNWEGNSGKKTKVAGGNMSRAVCQVQDCGVDLSNAKDYHRRHKVCEMHSKAGKTLVGNVMQRFCQQCSRFHVLQEFDEGKRSCRRRLAGHNKRRRKTNPDATGNGAILKDDHSSGYLLISLLRILSNMHSNGSDQTDDHQDLLAHILRSLANQTIENGGRNISGLLQEPRPMLNEGTRIGNSEQVVRVPDAKGANLPTTSSVKATMPNNYPSYSEVRDSTSVQAKLNNFDLNNMYIDLDDGTEDIERSTVPTNVAANSLDCPSWIRQDSHQSSPPQTSGNSDSASAHSPSSSSGEAQSRTDRIIFKLFGKEPNDFPLVLRAQILDWLAHSPTDIESYIRPGCVILTIYLRQAEATWEELSYNLGSSLSKLLDASDGTFWSSGWVYIRLQHQIAFVYNGHVVVDSSLPLRSNNYSQILSVKPIAVSASERAQFFIKGINLSRPGTRLLCAVEGNYIVQENTHESDGLDSVKGHDDLQCVNFICAIPTVSGRGFIEIEDHGFSSSFFPFIIAEEDVCSEIRMLECALEITETDSDLGGGVQLEAQSQAMDFIHEMGWLLHGSQLKHRLDDLDPNTDLFSLRRFKWLLEFSMDHQWCAVVKKLLNLLVNGIVGTGEHSSPKLALSEMGLLHRAVRRNSRSLVELLLRYVPEKICLQSTTALVGETYETFLFRPDVAGPAGLTPLHITAGKDGSEDVLDALTNDPGMVGIEAWKNARDSTGFTPEDYARLRGHYSYIHLVQKKINKRPATGHVVVDIPRTASDSKTSSQKQSGGGLSTSFEIMQAALRSRNCKHCSQKLACGTRGRSLLYRPAMLSMVAIAAVCVCVALLFKSCPEVVYVFRPFRWELLDYGTS